MQNFSRRRFLQASSAVTGSVIISTGLSGCVSTLKESITQAEFTHGVAAGDPTDNALIIWTRAVSPLPNTLVEWQVATDAEFTDIIRRGIAETSATTDHTIKVDVQSLESDTRYFYRFVSQNNSSPVGKAKTLPIGNIDHLKLAVFSCSNYPAGYFTPYAVAAQMPDLDAVLHLGDYIYEYAADGYATEKAEEIGRGANESNQTELFTLADYRNRYALYRTDKGLQAIHAAAAFIAVWDDHEIANDTYITGAENHNSGEGDFFDRRAQAIQAYYEWLPIRPPYGEAKPEIYRSFDFGDLVSLHMLDTRIIGREKQLSYADYRDENGIMDTESFTRDITRKDRTLLGTAQLNWLQTAITESSATWQVLGQQVLMGKMLFPAEVFASSERAQIPKIVAELAALKRRKQQGTALTEAEESRLNTIGAYNLDAWDGYPAEREKLLKKVNDLGKNLAVVAGDTHNAWCNKLTLEDGKLVGYEFATSSVSSPGMEKYLSLTPQQAKTMAKNLEILIDDLTYSNLHQRGLLTLNVTHKKIDATWHYVDNITTPEGKVVDAETISYPASPAP